MKFLDCPRLSLITNSLDNTLFGDRRVRGQVEAYSCKLAGDDKHMLKELKESASEEDSHIHFVPAVVPTESGGLRLLVNLMSAMNASFPEQDFSKVRSESFAVATIAQVARFANEKLATLYTSQPGVLSDMWAAIDEVISLRECKVLVFNPDNPEVHPYAGALWNFAFFFYNPKLNRLLLFGCGAWSSASPRISDTGYGSLSEDDEIEMY